MASSLDRLLTKLRKGTIPPVILVGGDSEFATERAFHAIRDAILASDPRASIESWPEGTDLGSILDSFRTHSLFGGRRILLVSELNAFVTKKEIAQLRDKALEDWSSAKTPRKRSSATARLLHAIGLTGASLEEPDHAIAKALDLPSVPDQLAEILAVARESKRRATRGEGDAALLMEAVTQGGAPGAVLLMRTGEVPAESATVAAIEKTGAVVRCDVTREMVPTLLREAIEAIAQDAKVEFDPAAIARLSTRLGIERALADKFAKEVPDIRFAVSEAERLVTLAGSSGRVTPELVDRHATSLEGGARYEVASLFSERKIPETIEKLRALVAQGRREDSSANRDILYFRYGFALAEEIRLLIGIHSFAKARGIRLDRLGSYDQFKATLADPLGDYLIAKKLARQRTHPFPLFKRVQGAAAYGEARLIAMLRSLARIEFGRKSGGFSAEEGLETFLAMRLG